MKRRMCSNYPIAQAADVEYERAQEQGHPRGIAVGIEDSPISGAIGMYLHSKGAFCLDDRSGKVDHLLAWNAMRHCKALPPQVVCYLLHILRARPIQRSKLRWMQVVMVEIGTGCIEFLQIMFQGSRTAQAQIDAQ